MSRPHTRGERETSGGQRGLRVGEAVRHALSELLRGDELHDPDLHGKSITVTEVRMSPDLRTATCYVMPLGGGEPDAVMAALRRAAPFLRRGLAGQVRMKFLPDLRFRWDDSFAASARIESLLREIAPAAADADDHDG